MPQRSATIHRLLDYGFIDRSMRLVAKNRRLHSPILLGRLAHLNGNRDSAIGHLKKALAAKATSKHDVERAVKLLTRLAPLEVLEWINGTERSRLRQSIEAAVAHNSDDQPYLPDPIGDEWLLNCNCTRQSIKKIERLNQYWREMGLIPIEISNPIPKSFDINSLQVGSDTQPNIGPVVSVIMTVHNGAAYLRSAALSILKQKKINTELIIIDDGSIDDTWKVLCNLKQEYPGRIICERLVQNVGTYRAKNIALQYAKRQFTAFQDADDWSHPDRLSLAIDWLSKDADHVAVTSRYIRLNSDGKFYSPAVWPIRQWSPNTLVFRREPVLRKLGNFDEARFGADTNYFERIRAAFGDARIKFQNEVMLIAMSLPSSLMHNTTTGVDSTGYSTNRTRYREATAEFLLDRILRNEDSFKIF